MVRIMAEESQAQTAIGKLLAISRYKQVGDSGYVRVQVQIGKEKIWMSHWGSFEEIEDKYKDLNIGDRIQIAYIKRAGKKNTFYKIVSIAPAPESTQKKESIERKTVTAKRKIINSNTIEKLEELYKRLDQVLEAVLYLRDVVATLYDIDLPRLEDRMKIINEKLDTLLEAAKK